MESESKDKNIEIYKNFFINILEVETGEATQMAKKITESLSKNVLERLLCFINFTNDFSLKNTALFEKYKDFCVGDNN